MLSNQEDIDLDLAASWTWSADLPHYVHISAEHVTLSRWDDPAAIRRFIRQSVESKIDTFYSYLVLDRVRNKYDIVEHSVDLLRRIRSHVSEQGLADEASIHIFLFVIAFLLSRKADAYGHAELLPTEYALDATYTDAFLSLGPQKLEALIDQFRSPSLSLNPRSLEVIPELLVRHASGTVFQEAHFELIRGTPTDLFGLPGVAEVTITTRGGTHFTPPGLARAIVERAFDEVDLSAEVTIFDPACGAGSFLIEALRYLQRRKYKGAITLIGYDLSPIAVVMARFALYEAKKDWPQGRVESIRIEMHDSLDDDTNWPRTDILLMNPPFISWGNQTEQQRQSVKAILGKGYSGRPDYSMAFIEKALSFIKTGGVMGTLFPSSVLSLEASLKWRQHLLDQATPRFLAVLGDHGLFRHAIIEVASAVFALKKDQVEDGSFISLWTNEKRGVSGEALRNLRKLAALQHKSGIVSPSMLAADDWRISLLGLDHLRETPDWRPRPNRLEEVLKEIRKAFHTKVQDIFHVHEGIRAGLRNAFILSVDEYESLPPVERKYFRPVAENKNIRNGRIESHEYIFYPDSAGLPPIVEEEDLKRSLPVYFARFLEPNREQLRKRVGLGPRPWWLLNRPRSYFAKPEVKLVSAFFGDAGSFALDLDGSFVVVQGFVWLPRPSLNREFELVPPNARSGYRNQVLHSYLALLNSKIFTLLLEEFCPHVAGGCNHPIK